MKDLTILKIGGSVITEKKKESSARYEEMQRISKEISQSQKTKSEKMNLILIHGAGSFGHIQAEKYGLNNSFDSEGILITHNAVKELNRIFLGFLSRYGLSVSPVHPMSCAVLKDGRIKSFFTEQIELMLKNGIIPVLHGDVVFDEKSGVKILSGDQLVSYLAKNVKAKKKSVGLGSNVDGVLVEDQLIKRITPKVFEDIKDHLKGSDSADVTGGMYGKVIELLNLAKDGTSSCVFNALEGGNVYKFLMEEEQIGTYICKS